MGNERYEMLFKALKEEAHILTFFDRLNGVEKELMTMKLRNIESIKKGYYPYQIECLQMCLNPDFEPEKLIDKIKECRKPYTKKSDKRVIEEKVKIVDDDNDFWVYLYLILTSKNLKAAIMKILIYELFKGEKPKYKIVSRMED
jgi:hypothetical protein